MTDFDKLIKEKAEEATYSYKPSAWRRFQKQTGTFSSLKYWVSGVAATMIAGASVGLYFHHHSAAPTANQPERVVVTQDTLTNTPAVQSDSATEIVVMTPKEKTVSKQPDRIREKEEAATPQPEAVPSSVKTKTVTREPLGRPVVINVDTIKDNVPSDEELKKGNSRLF